MKKAEEAAEGEEDEIEEEEEEEVAEPRKRFERPETIEDKVFNEMNEEALDYYDSTIGRYIPGYRHYENYEAYAIKYPERTIAEYAEDMNREVTFEEYLDISVTALRFFLRVSPKIRMEIYDLTDGQPEKIEWILNSPELREKTREQFNARLRDYYQAKLTFKLVDALEEYMEMGYYGKEVNIEKAIPHMMNPYQMVSFQKFFKSRSEPGLLNTHKIGPTDFPNPFKSSPTRTKAVAPVPRMTKMVFNKKYRRMGGAALNNMKFYSTVAGKLHHTMNYPITYMPFVVKK